MSNSDVTLKITQSYTFRFKFGFENPKLFYKEIKKNLIFEKFLNLHLSVFKRFLKIKKYFFQKFSLILR